MKPAVGELLLLLQLQWHVQTTSQPLSTTTYKIPALCSFSARVEIMIFVGTVMKNAKNNARLKGGRKWRRKRVE